MDKYKIMTKRISIYRPIRDLKDHKVILTPIRKIILLNYFRILMDSNYMVIPMDKIRIVTIKIHLINRPIKLEIKKKNFK